MLYTFFSSVFIALVFVVGTIALYKFLELMRLGQPICFICACIFGAQIPTCYGS